MHRMVFSNFRSGEFYNSLLESNKHQILRLFVYRVRIRRWPKKLEIVSEISCKSFFLYFINHQLTWPEYWKELFISWRYKLSYLFCSSFRDEIVACLKLDRHYHVCQTRINQALVIDSVFHIVCNKVK